MTPLDPDIAGQLADALPRGDYLRLLQTFETDIGRLAAEYRDAARAGDGEAMRRAAHSLAGTAAGIGARSLEAVARQAMAGYAAAGAEAGLAARITDEAEAVVLELAELADQNGW